MRKSAIPEWYRTAFYRSDCRYQSAPPHAAVDTRSHDPGCEYTAQNAAL